MPHTWIEKTTVDMHVAYTNIGHIAVQYVHFGDGTGSVLYHDSDTGYTRAKKTATQHTATRVAHRLADRARAEFRAALDEIAAAADNA